MHIAIPAQSSKQILFIIATSGILSIHNEKARNDCLKFLRLLGYNLKAIIRDNIEKANEILVYFSTPDESKEKIAEVGYEKLLNSSYTYTDRAKKIIEVYNNLRNA